jgi:hypothetical protein
LRAKSPAENAAVDASPSSSHSRYEKLRIEFVIAAAALRRRLCADKEAAGAGEGVPTGLRFDQVGRLICLPASRAHRRSCSIFDGAGSTVWLAAPKHETKISPSGEEESARPYFWKMAAWRTIELQLR